MVNNLMLNGRWKPDMEMLEAVYREEIQKDWSMQELLKSYDRGIRFEGKKKSYEQLQEYGTVELETREQDRIRKNALQTREPRATPAKGKGCPKGTCYQYWNTGKCAKMNSGCPYKHDKINPDKGNSGN